jgi:hypothetical protein
MQKSIIFSVFFCFFFFVASSQDHATRTMKKEMKAYNKKINDADKAQVGESEFAKAPKKPLLQRLGIVKVNSLIPHFLETAGKQDKKTSKRMRKNYRKAKKRMKKNFSVHFNLFSEEHQLEFCEV